MTVTQNLFKDSDPMSLLLGEAVKSAKGTQYLSLPVALSFNPEVSDDCKRCMWGEAAYLAGVPDKKMNRTTDFPGTFAKGDAFTIWGWEEWDNGNPDKAIVEALTKYGTRTIGDFRKFLRKVGWL